MSGRKAAPRPQTRTVSVELDGAWAGWVAEAKADFSAGLLADLQSGEVDRVLDALQVIVLDHNMPDVTGEVAVNLRNVDPYEGLLLVATAIIEAISKLPNR